MAEASKSNVYVIGIGMTKFLKPNATNDDYPELCKEAVEKALKDAKLTYEQIQFACVGYCYGDSASGQRSLYKLGMTGIPIVNVSNTCASGSTALYMCNQMIAGGLFDCALALGFEKMDKGAIPSPKYIDRARPLSNHLSVMSNLFGIASPPIVPQFFSNAGKEHMAKYGTRLDHFAKIAVKNHKHSVNNPNAQFQREYSLEEVQNSQVIHEPLTKLQCCPTSDGAAAAILASEKFVTTHNLQSQAVKVLGMELTTDVSSAFEENSSIKLIGFDMTANAANKLYEKTGIRPTDVDVIELHDSFSTNELIVYEALGLCDVGKGGELVDSGDNTYGGKYVINPSGGLISKGHPVGATGIAQCAELCWQLRGTAGARQVPNPKLGLQHNIGLGGAVVVALYEVGFPNEKLETSSCCKSSKKVPI